MIDGICSVCGEMVSTHENKWPCGCSVQDSGFAMVSWREVLILQNRVFLSEKLLREIWHTFWNEEPEPETGARIGYPLDGTVPRLLARIRDLLPELKDKIIDDEVDRR